MNNRQVMSQLLEKNRDRIAVYDAEAMAKSLDLWAKLMKDYCEIKIKGEQCETIKVNDTGDYPF